MPEPRRAQSEFIEVEMRLEQMRDLIQPGGRILSS